MNNTTRVENPQRYNVFSRRNFKPQHFFINDLTETAISFQMLKQFFLD